MIYKLRRSSLDEERRLVLTPLALLLAVVCFYCRTWTDEVHSLANAKAAVKSSVGAGSSSNSNHLLADSSSGTSTIDKDELKKAPAVQPKEGSGAFIHIGKTGGSTLTRYLRNACHSFVPKPCGVVPNETIVSRLVGTYYHVPDFDKLPQKQHSFYLISLRDPLERTISGFVYGHPWNVQARGEDNINWAKRTKTRDMIHPKCFETLEQFVENLGDDPDKYVYDHPLNWAQQENCTNFCRAAMHSKVRRFVHLFYNYEKIHSLLPTPLEEASNNNKNNNMTIYVTRQHYLLADWIHINRLLGETGEIVFARETNVRNVTGMSLPVTRELSETGRKRLCQALIREYDNYMEFLLHAVNLNQEDIQEALQQSRKNCPELAVLSEEHWTKRIENKGVSKT